MTILGQHTALETNQLVQATQSRVDDMQKAYDNNSTQWRARDAATEDQWSEDFQSWKDQWVETLIAVGALQAGERGAEISLGSMSPFLMLAGSAASLSANLQPDEGNYNRVLMAVAWPATEPNTVVDGNLNGLDSRLTQGLGVFARATAPIENAEDFDTAFITSTPAMFANAAVNDAAAVADFLDGGNKPPSKPLNPFNILFGVVAAVGLAIAGLIGFNVVETAAIKRVYKKVL